MSNRFASGKKALAICDRCGSSVKLRELKNEIVKGRDTNLKVCRSCYDPDHPQLRLGEFPVDDPQALQYSRPDVAEFPEERALTLPVPQQSTSAVSGGAKGVTS